MHVFVFFIFFDCDMTNNNNMKTVYKLCNFLKVTIYGNIYYVQLSLSINHHKQFPQHFCNSNCHMLCQTSTAHSIHFIVNCEFRFDDGLAEEKNHQDQGLCSMFSLINVLKLKYFFYLLWIWILQCCKICYNMAGN